MFALRAGVSASATPVPDRHSSPLKNSIRARRAFAAATYTRFPAGKAARIEFFNGLLAHCQ